MTEEEMLGKFHSLADPVIGAKRAQALAAMALDIERVPDTSVSLKMTSVR